jgi:hypothetical protein
MNTQMFFSVIDQFNQGNIQFNLGTNWSFLFNNQWYPTRAFMRAYFQQLGQNNDYNLHQSVFELSKFIPIVSADITYNYCLPVANT